MATVADTWKKSILLEIVNRNNPSNIVEAFTLVVPPENIELDEEQRVSRRKTFGGIFIDDYGPDVGRMIISGNTGNTEVKKTYIPPGVNVTAPDTFTGKQAFYYMRDRLMRYKTNQKIRDTYQNYDIRVYDLSTVEEAKLKPTRQVSPANLHNAALKENPTNTVAGEAEGYVVSLDRFKMTRSKDKPLWYSFVIELVVLRALGSFKATALSRIPKVNPLDVIHAIRRSLNTIKTTFTTIKHVLDPINDAINFSAQVVNELGNYFNEANDLVVYPASTCKLFLGKVKTIIDNVNTYIDSEADTSTRNINEYYKIWDLTKDIGQSCAALVNYAKQPGTTGVSTIKTNSEPTSTKALLDAYNDVSESDSDLYTNIVNKDVSEPISFRSSGYVPVTITGGTSLESIAMEYYGDPSLQELITVYNGISDVNDLSVGDTVKVPVLIQGNTLSKNFVYSLVPTDIYGSDIKLDSDGGIVVGESGDFMGIEGPDNLVQALNLRLEEELGKRLRLVVYGLRTQIGFPMSSKAPISYILTNIKDTILQDPRITDILNIKIKGVADSLLVSFDTSTIKVGDVVPYTGSI